MKAVIIGGGSLDADFSLSYVKQEKPDMLIAVDRGLSFCHEAGLRPDVILGDFDSVDPAILEGYRQEGIVPIDTYDSHKDYTDMELGMRKALELGCSQAILLGATGTRLDHTLTNIQCLPILEDAGVWISTTVSGCCRGKRLSAAAGSLANTCPSCPLAGTWRGSPSRASPTPWRTFICPT